MARGQGFDPPLATDLDPDPHVVEVELVAAETDWEYVPGVPTHVWAYDGTIPGPTIVANVGDTVRVHFRNELPEETTVHWHGVEVPADVDGSHIAQLVVPPGGTFEYEFVPRRAAMYWYHPHVRPFDQIEKGLYGVLLVRDPEKEHALGLDRVEEHVLVFDDVLLDANSQIVPAFSFTDPLQNAMYQLNGRPGNVLLVNGRESRSLPLEVPNGKPQRWRCLNAANSTFCRLDVNDSVEGFPDSQLWELGTDGGFEERAFPRFPVRPFTPRHPTYQLLAPMGQGIFLLPGERLDVLFTPHGQDGSSHRVYQHDWVRGRHIASYGIGGQITLLTDPNDGLRPKVPYFDVVLRGPDPGAPYYEPPQDLLTDVRLPGEPVGDLPVVFGHGDPDPAGNIPMFLQAKTVNGVFTPLPASKIDSFEAHDVNVGEVWDWQVTNLTHGDHPFHVHGFFFIPYEYEFQDDVLGTGNFTFRPGRLLLKDTVRIPARGGNKGTSRTITRMRTLFDDTGREGRVAAMGTLPTFAPDGSWTSGGWLFHCHVLEHSARGMLSLLEVHEREEVFRLLGKALAGTSGLASLTGAGSPAPGGTVRLELVGAAPSTPVTLVLGSQLARASLRSGTLVPSADLLFTATTDAAGRATWQASAAALPAGTRLWAQAGFPDAGAAGGLALSNALTFEVP